ncbi:MAG TPA: ABC transporter ATP-binding protein [Acidimicrobiales bacterium]|jgi:ABC-type polysaccharide/polyol phosphate transport system ATPase subunit|nr:ABC transporter ATP-binding protein [Acidimicrobiales bacterium]
MLPEGSIAASHLWKRFRADKRHRVLREQVAKVSDRLRGRRRGWRWALRDVDLHVEPGEAVGLMGPNGSGKSTLLKILTRVMYPYAGRLEVSGRVGALIEVRAGIHPQLTGRENAFLYGSLLGLNRRQVQQRFDEIVAFAQLEDAIDRQTKFYSSGMQMRLGFSVAAFLEPDILLVDEILAVGDSSFQQRCLERMSAALAEGVSLVFVSHDLAAIEAVTTRGVLLDQGRVRMDGPVRDVLNHYRQSVEEVAELQTVESVVKLVDALVAGSDGRTVRTQEEALISLTLDSPGQHAGSICLGLSEGTATPIVLLRFDANLPPGPTEVRCRLPRLPLPRGRYYLWVAFVRRRAELLPWHPAAHFDVIGPDLDSAPLGIMRLSPVHVDAHWELGRS